MPGEDEELVAARGVRDARRSVSAGRHDMLAVGAERDVRQGVRVAGEARHVRPQSLVRQMRAVPSRARARDELAVRAERTATALPACSGQRVDAPAALPRPRRARVSSAPPVRTRRLSGEIAAERAPRMRVRVQSRPVRQLDEARATGLDDDGSVAVREIAAAQRASTPGTTSRRRRPGATMRTRPSRPVTSAVPSSANDASRRPTPVGTVWRRRRAGVASDDFPSSVTATTASPRRTASRAARRRRRRLGRATASSARRSDRSDALARDPAPPPCASRRLSSGIAVEHRVWRSRRARSPSPRAPARAPRVRCVQRVERHAAHRGEQHGADRDDGEQAPVPPVATPPSDARARARPRALPATRAPAGRGRRGRSRSGRVSLRRPSAGSDARTSVASTGASSSSDDLAEVGEIGRPRARSSSRTASRGG